MYFMIRLTSSLSLQHLHVPRSRVIIDLEKVSNSSENLQMQSYHLYLSINKAALQNWSASNVWKRHLNGDVLPQPYARR